MARGLFNLFVEATAWMTDSQYYALVIILSLGIGCAVALWCEQLLCRWKHEHTARFFRRVHRVRHIGHFRDAA